MGNCKTKKERIHAEKHVGMTLVFYRIRPAAGLLQIPYLIWVAFAGYLNYAIWQLNP